MVRIDKVTTRGGDTGQTSLGDGSRVAKGSARIEAIGAVDEANAALGVLRLHAGGAAQDMLARIQNDMFDVGADLAVPGEAGERLRLTDAPSLRLEREAAVILETLPPLTSFVIPGGTPGSAHAHVARTVVRRAERAAVRLAAEEPLGAPVLRYLNRLSDLLFILGRALDGAGLHGEALWVPGANLD